MTRVPLLTAARVLAVIVLAAGAFAGGWLATDAARDDGPTGRAALPRAYGAAGSTPTAQPSGTPAPMPAPSRVGAVLARAAHAPELGSGLLAEVVDAQTGRLLYAQHPTGRAASASTAKLLTAAALLTVRRVSDRITTTVVAGRDGQIVLVGGGDPTLSGAKQGATPVYPGAARISDLADQLRRANVDVRSVRVDDSLFSGRSVSPAWAPEDVPSFYASAITPVLTDGGRAAPGDYSRSAAPDLAAGRELAAALGRPGLPVRRGTAPPGSRVLARVKSAPIGTLVEQMLQESDNVIAECLARQVAIAEHRPASFVGAAQAIRSVLRRLGADPGGGLVDGSGLASRDRLSPAALTSVLRLIAGSTRPALHVVLAALPVGGWSGTLADRYLSGSARRGAGVVRAKTGTLSGVATLAGLVHDASGRLLVFAFLAPGVVSTDDADRALDRLTARLADCGCS